MRVLGLDLASTTGWAVVEGNNRLHSGTWNIAPRKGESPGCRYIHLRRHLEWIHDAFRDIGLVVCERPHHRGRAATEYGIGCLTEVQKFCAEHEIEHTDCPSGTLKKFATGAGNASKEDMVRCAEERWNMDVGLVDDEADALWCAEYGRLEILGGTA